ncbi:MAG: hypothetical protein ABIU10_08565 [Sphingomicrobium sp.]
MERFDPEMLDRTIGSDARDAMLDVILSWARFDSFTSKWMPAATFRLIVARENVVICATDFSVRKCSFCMFVALSVMDDMKRYA